MDTDQSPAATASSWKTDPLPPSTTPLHLEARFSDADYAMIKLGLVPLDMEDRWFIYLDDDGWLHLYRSWTGHWIFGIRLARDESDSDPERPWRVVDSWVINDPHKYAVDDVQQSRQSARSVIDNVLLYRPAHR